MMMKPTKPQAKAYIQEALDEIPSLTNRYWGAPEFEKWRRNTRIAINNIFGDSPGHVQEWDNISFYGSLEYHFGLNKASGMLASMIDEIETWWSDDIPSSIESDNLTLNKGHVSNRVFVVHGRDEATKQMVARFLEGVGLDPVILQEQPNEGRTIIEKFFEEYAQVGFAVVLCTPDDVGALESERDKIQPRPRQNVVLEWGFFLGKIGRNRVCALFKGGVEIPSDYDGVIYIPLDDFGGWRVELAKEMRAVGLSVDMNRI